MAARFGKLRHAGPIPLAIRIRADVLAAGFRLTSATGLTLFASKSYVSNEVALEAGLRITRA